MIYVLVLMAVIVWLGLIKLNGYRNWFVSTFYIVAAVAFLGGSIAHRIGGGGPQPHLSDIGSGYAHRADRPPGRPYLAHHGTVYPKQIHLVIAGGTRRCRHEH
jgi:hypothetical protein